MSEGTAEAAPAPAMIRQEGPHRVSVAPGATSAYAKPAPLDENRLRTEPTGVDRRSVPSDGTGPGAPAARLRTRGAGDAASSTSVRHQIGPDGAWQRQPEPPSERQRRESAAQALQERLNRLAALNAETSRRVAAAESTVLKAAGPPE